MNHEFRSVPRIICEAGALQELGYVFRSLGAQRVLLVCDPGIVSLGFAGRAQAVLQASGCAVAVFDQVTPDPSSAVVEQAASQAKAFQADGVLGLGGGDSRPGVSAGRSVSHPPRPRQRFGHGPGHPL